MKNSILSVAATKIKEMLQETIVQELGLDLEHYNRYEVNKRVRFMKKSERNVWIGKAVGFYAIVKDFDIQIDANIYNCLAFYRDVHNGTKQLQKKDYYV